MYSQVYVQPFEQAPGFICHHTNYAAVNTFLDIYEHGQLGMEGVYGNRVNLD